MPKENKRVYNNIISMARRMLRILSDIVLARFRRLGTATLKLSSWMAGRDGARYAKNWHPSAAINSKVSAYEAPANPLMVWFSNHNQGGQVWKWHHYFDAYHRHLAHLVGKPITVVEVGVLGGGSLEMWSTYFGPLCSVYGIDNDPQCKSHKNERISVLTGDQQDRHFWATFKSQVAAVDVVIDDGGHRYEQQKVTLEEMLPHLRPGGVYICEDVHRSGNLFEKYCAGLVAQLNRMEEVSKTASGAVVKKSAYQQSVHSIHFYPYMIVIEKQRGIESDFVSEKRSPHGTVKGIVTK